MRATATLILLAGLAACQKLPSGQSPVTEKEALGVATATEADYGSGDTAKIMNHYAKGAYVIDAGNAMPSEDAKTVNSWTSQFVSMKPADFDVTSRKIKVLGPDSFVSAGVAGFTVQAGQARPRVSVRFLQAYQRQGDGNWKIVAEHMSSPPTPVAAAQ